MSSFPIDSNNVDRISNLPESILYHILSILPAKDAVATSLLSTRWESLWKNINNLVFSDQDRMYHKQKEKEKFAHFVNNMLILLNNQCIDEFSLDVYRYTELYDVCTWISAAIAKEVKVFSFTVRSYNYYDPDPPFTMPRSLFTCKTLKNLFLGYYVFINLPRVVCFPNLKTLHLESVIYESDESIRKLISGCLVLETLYIIRREHYDNVVTFTICSPTLKNLTFISKVFKEYPKELDYKLEINAPALRYLELDDRFSRDFSVENLCSVEEAKVEVYFNESMLEYDRYSQAVAKLVQGLYNVKNLSLEGSILKALSHADATLNFMELSRLTTEISCCDLNLLSNLFEGLSKLQFLTLKKNDHNKCKHVTCWSIPEKTPIWLFSCLETMSFCGFKALADEFAMVDFILKNGKQLRTVTIDITFCYDLKVKYELFQKVSKLPRGSEECEITFS